LSLRLRWRVFFDSLAAYLAVDFTLNTSRPITAVCFMAQIVFDNPNVPEQPAKGVYRWFYRDADTEITIYVGCAGNRRETVGSPSTLKRGIQEAQRSCVSSDKGRLLDTDFVVGTVLMYLKQRGYDCVWQHVSDDPADERKLSADYRPLLQSNGSIINRRFRLAKPGGQLWVRTDVELAERLLMAVLHEHLHHVPARQ
jgi:hypothetical protein